MKKSLEKASPEMPDGDPQKGKGKQCMNFNEQRSNKNS